MRFPRFEEEWRKVRFSEIGEFFKGAGISKDQLSDHGMPCILYGELYTKYKSEVIKTVVSKTSIDTRGLVRSKTNDIIIPSSGESAEDIATACCVNLDDVLLGGDLNVIRPHMDNGNFVSYQLNGKRKLDIAKIAQGSSVIHLYNNSLKNLQLYLPHNIKEQNKIASLLSTIDSRIETQNKIIEKLETLIKGLREQMFCDESNDIPYLRFPQFTEVWKQIKLKDLADRVTRRNKGNKTNLALTIAAKNGLVDQTSFFNKQIAAVDMSNYYHVCNGDFAYNKSYSIDYPWGAVKRLDKYPEGALSTLYFCFRPFGSVNSDYLVHYFETTKWHKGISDISGEGARNHGLLNMSIIDYFDTEHSVPENLEQGKIASFLNLLSQRLLTEKGTLKKYQQQKTYFLINLFI